MDIILKACSEPARQIIRNKTGFTSVDLDEYLVKDDSIIDPVKVVKNSL